MKTRKKISQSSEKNRERRLANLKPPFKPGQSGNPSGRPKRRSIDGVLEELLLTKDHKVAEAIARVLDGKARPGDLQAIRSSKMEPANGEKVAQAIIEASKRNAEAAKLLLDLTEGEIP